MKQFDNKSLFILTAEEVEIFKNLLQIKLRSLKRDLRDWKEDVEIVDFSQKEIDKYRPILTRIKQWQNEQDKCDNPVD